MAKHTEVTLVDDISGEPADENVEFGVDGKIYEIDLSEKNAGRLRDALAEFVDAARLAARVVKPRGARAMSGTSASAARNRTDREESQAIREWARSRNMKVSDRGRISSTVLEAYQQAHQGQG